MTPDKLAVPEDEYTEIDIGDGEFIISCDNCGAYAPKGEVVQHHETCRPGESKFWEEHYATMAEEEATASEEGL